jgi:hypothetical protein
MLTTAILIFHQLLSSIIPCGVRLDSVLREICCHDLISSLEQLENNVWCDDAESKVMLGWSQLWGRVGDSVHAAFNIVNVSVIQEPKTTNNSIFNLRKRSELEFTFRDSVIRPWVIFRQAVGDDDIQHYYSYILFEKHNEPSSHCAFLLKL